MLSNIKVRLAVFTLLVLLLSIWYMITASLWSDYQELINLKPEVTLSLISLWVPVGMLGGVITIIIMSSKALYLGVGMTDCFSPKAVMLVNRTCKYFAILGIFTAIGFAWHSFNLLDEYGYQYNSKLTKITPTGIHLVYTKP